MFDGVRTITNSPDCQSFASQNPTLLCVPSQNGLLEEAPHLQSATLSAESIFSPEEPDISTGPETINGPSLRICIVGFVSIFHPLPLAENTTGKS